MSKFYDYCCTCQHLYEECHRGACSTCDNNACNYVYAKSSSRSNLADSESGFVTASNNEYVNCEMKIVEKETDEMTDFVKDNNTSKREQILMTAKNIVCSDRNKQYGEPEDNFRSIAELWSVYTGLTLTAKDVALMMTLFKIARLMANPEKDDSWIDAAGYIACGAECAIKGE